MPPDFPLVPPKPPGPSPTGSFPFPTPNSTQMKIRITAEIAGENAFEPRWLKDLTGQFQREHKQGYEPAACCDSPQTVITFRCFMKPRGISSLCGFLQWDKQWGKLSALKSFLKQLISMY